MRFPRPLWYANHGHFGMNGTATLVRNPLYKPLVFPVVALPEFVNRWKSQTAKPKKIRKNLLRFISDAVCRMV